MYRQHKPLFGLAALMLLMILVGACQKEVPVAPELPDLSVGVVSVIQPMGTVDLLAGYIPEDRVLAKQKDLDAFSDAMMQSLQKKTVRKLHFVRAANDANATADRSASRNGALAYWTSVGKKAGVDLLIVPMVANWHEREGSPAGVTKSADVMLDFYLLDVRGEGELLSRSHYSEKQVGLSNDLTQINLFVKRGGKWVSAQDLGLEAVEKMVKEFGL